MWQAVFISALIVLFLLGGLLAIKQTAKMGLPKKMPPPLVDEEGNAD